MNKYLMLLISSFILNIGGIYSCYKIQNKKISLKNYKLYIAYILFVILIFLNYAFSNNIYKVFITLIIMFLITKILFNIRAKECILNAVIMELTTIVAELIFSVVMVLINNLDNQTFAQIYQGQIISNFVITSLIILIAASKIPTKIYNKISKILPYISVNKTIVFMSFVIMCSSFLFYLSYYNKNNFFNLLINFIIVTLYFIIVVMILKKENNYNKVYSKYLTTINELNEYENIINEYRIINHENKNQLLYIKGMTRNRKINEYIDAMMNNKSSDNKKLLDQALLIPTGGLRGLIYSKIVQMKEKNIGYSLNIDRKLNSSLIKKINSKEMIDICQIIGVFIDNSIEAVEELEDKNIVINIYNEEDFVIEIINNYNNNIDLNRIDKIGYTTKGSNHGYGLALVNKILSKNKNFSNEREVSKKIFKQKLIIKL